jgi:hypothetical protein
MQSQFWTVRLLIYNVSFQTNPLNSMKFLLGQSYAFIVFKKKVQIIFTIFSY